MMPGWGNSHLYGVPHRDQHVPDSVDVGRQRGRHKLKVPVPVANPI